MKDYPGEKQAVDRGGNRLWLEFSKAYDRFLKIHGDPREIALGFALGLFIGMTPYMGFQTAMAVLLAALFKWSKISAATAVWISNPVTAPIIYSVTYWVGSRMLGIGHASGRPHDLNLERVLQLLVKVPKLFGILTLGGVVVGIPLAIAGYYVCHAAILKYRRRTQRGRAGN